MKKNNGMRPQDIVVLLKICLVEKSAWFNKDIAIALGISPSEIGESISRSNLAGLIASDRRTVMKSALLEFLQHGLKYAYPQKPGALVRGMRTAHSAPPLNRLIQTDEIYVWPWAKGKDRGQGIEPLHVKIPEACSKDNRLYELLALTDALRVGRIREQNLAIQELEKKMSK